MSEPEKPTSADETFIRAVWQEARDLVARLEGSTVQRFSVEAGGTKIEIERAASGVPMAPGALPTAPAPSEAAETDDRHPILAPLVGTFFRAPQPGAKPFVEEGDSVDAGQTVAIIEAMKLLNHVQADRAGRVSEILCKDGDWVEYEQPVMYLDPIDG